MTLDQIIQAVAQGHSQRLTREELQPLIRLVRQVSKLKFRGEYSDDRRSLALVWIKLLKAAPGFKGYGQPGAAASWLRSLVFTCVHDQIAEDTPPGGRLVRIDDLIDPMSGRLRDFSEVDYPGGALKSYFAAAADHDLMRQWIADDSTEEIDTQALLDLFYSSLRAMSVDEPSLAQAILLSVTVTRRVEAARMLGITAGTFSNRSTIARSIFREYLPEDWKGVLGLVTRQRKGL